MKPPSAKATREALNWFGPDMKPQSEAVDWFAPDGAVSTVLTAARAWSRIAPDADVEWSEEMMDQLAEAGSPIEWEEGKRHIPRARARAVLAELVRLAEGSDE